MACKVLQKAILLTPVLITVSMHTVGATSAIPETEAFSQSDLKATDFSCYRTKNHSSIQ